MIVSVIRHRRTFRIILRLLLIISFFLSLAHLKAGDGTLRRIPVPILMYHYVSPLPEDADDIRIGLTVQPEIFASHMQYLADAGYTTISFYQLHDALMNGAAVPPNPVILSFDDGYVDHYSYVFPVLQRLGFTATFFIITGRADEGNPAHLSWEQIAEMSAAGMNMEAHTKTHPSLQGRDRDFLIYEMLGSRESLFAHTQQESRMLAYPAGRYDDLTLQIAQELDFWLAVTTEPGISQTSTTALQLPRVRIGPHTGVGSLAALLRGA